MSKRRKRSKPLATAAPGTAPVSPPGFSGWWIRGVTFLAIGCLSVVGFRGGVDLWIRETTLGRASALAPTATDNSGALAFLAATVAAHPNDGAARYLLGTTLLRIEQERAQKGPTQAIRMDRLDVAMDHLLQSLRTTLFPARTQLAIGQALLFGARLAMDEQNPALVRPFAERALPFLLRSLSLDPTPSGNVADLWVETARAAALLDRPDIVLFALSHLENRTLTQPPTPALAARVPALRQNAAFDLANAPLLTSMLYLRWRRDPANLEIWKQLYKLGEVPGGETSSLYLLERLVQQFPDQPVPQQLLDLHHQHISPTP